MPKKMVLLDETTLERLVRQLKEVTEKLEEFRGLFEEEYSLRDQIKEHMIENNIKKSTAHGINVTIGIRKNTQVLDMEQIERTLQYRGILEECKVLDMGKVRKVLGDDALGIETTEHKYLIVKNTRTKEETSD